MGGVREKRRIQQDELNVILTDHKKWGRSNGTEGAWADLSGALLFKKSLIEADLSGANLHGADLHGADLRGADLRRADLRGATLTQADLSKAKLNAANLNKTSLIEATLSEADLTEAKLTMAKLDTADLSAANLSEANLTKAKLNSANLWRACLIGSDLRKSNVTGTRFYETYLGSAIMDSILGAGDAHGLETVRFDAPPKQQGVPGSQSNEIREKSVNDIHYFNTCKLRWVDRWLNWASFRLTGKIPIFSASWFALSLIPVYYFNVDLYNESVKRMEGTLDGLASDLPVVESWKGIVLDESFALMQTSSDISHFANQTVRSSKFLSGSAHRAWPKARDLTMDSGRRSSFEFSRPAISTFTPMDHLLL